MKLKTTLRIAAATFGLMAAALVPAMAGNFASFSQTTTNSNPWTFTNNGASSTFTASTAVTFSYSVPNGYGAAGTPIAAHISFSGTPTSTAFNVLGQDFQPLTITSMVITADTPVGGLSNLLSLTGTGVIVGTNNAYTAGLTGDTTVPGQTVNFSSDFLSFSGEEAFSFAYTLKNPNTPLVIKASNSYLKTFLASGTGTFSAGNAHTGVPEPSTNAAFLFGGLGLLGLIAFGRKTRAGSMAS